MHTTTHANPNENPADTPALVWDRHPGGHSRAIDGAHKYHVYQSGFCGKGGRRFTAEISCRRSGRPIDSSIHDTAGAAKIWCRTWRDTHRTWPAARRA